MTRPLNRKEASTYLFETFGIVRKPNTLARLACVGGGPRFFKAGRTPLYTIECLDEWAASTTTPLVANTSELDAMRLLRRQRRRPDGRVSTD